MLIPGLLVLAATVAACDTDDGRELRPPNAGATTTTTVAGGSASTTGVVVAPESPVDSVPGGRFQLVLPFSGGRIDRQYTCDGEDLAPQVSWLDVPPEAVELALVVVDLDADGFVHWIAAGIDPASGSLLPDTNAAVVEAENSFGDIGWGGPCPPPDDGAHRYEFTLYAVGQPLEIAPGSPASDAMEAIEGGSVSRASAIAEYER